MLHQLQTEVMRHCLTAKKYLATVICLLQAAFLLSQEGQVKGRISNGTDNLSAATVTIGNKTMLTNINGEFAFSLKAGSYTLAITHAGYKKIEQKVKVDAGTIQTFDFIMTPADLLDEVVVLGSRSQIPRSSLNTAVPVDVFSSEFLRQTGQTSIMQMMNFTAPSLNASRELANEPVTFHGLDPQYVLFTLNGTRYHNQVLMNEGQPKGILGRGSVGNDLSSIPFAAIEKVEILREGASAQYGSDAIAAVMNFRLKQSTGKTEIHLNNGQYYKGDGEKYSLDIYHGFLLNKKSLPAGRQGFISIAGSIQFRKPTYRGGRYEGTVYKTIPENASIDDSMRIRKEDDSIIAARNFDFRKVIGNIGNIQQLNAGILLNGAYKIKSNAELFGTLTFNYKKVRRESEYRFPKDSDVINFSLYPDGFGPISTPNTRDVSAITGIRGETKNKWHWELTSSFGRNKLIRHISNTNNPSQSYLGKDAQTNFHPGKLIYNQLTNNINLTKSFTGLPDNINLFNIGCGAEWRWENFRTKAGDSASWSDPDFAFNPNTPAGSQGNVGIHPRDVVNKDRNAIGAYIDMETEIKNKLLLNVAGRYEFYSDFGDNLSGKLAVRYKLDDNFSLRGSVGNGFRAPSLQQRFLKSINNGLIPGPAGLQGISLRGIFPYDHEVAKAFHIPSLTAENSLNLSGGFTGKIFDHISFTIDAYWIQIKNRIVLTGTFDKNNPDVKIILDNFYNQTGIKVVAVQFFTNAINTRTKGIDIVMDGKWKISKSVLGFMLGANFTQTRLFGNIKTTDKLRGDSLLFNLEEKARIEKGQPESKIILSADYMTGKFLFTLRNTRFGNIATTTLLSTDTLYESYSPKLLTDFSISYSPKKWITMTAGANNIFDIYPDLIKNYGNTFEGRLIYSPEASPFGFNGGYYFMSMAFTW